MAFIDFAQQKHRQASSAKIRTLTTVFDSFEKTDIVGIVVGQIGSSAMSAVSLAMGVALYGLIVGAQKDVAATFE